MSNREQKPNGELDSIPIKPDASGLSTPTSVHSAPRRFDVFTILSVLAFFAIAFAILTALKAPAEFIGGLSVFVTLIGLGQAFLWKGKKPRLASIVVGAFYFAISLGIPYILSGPLDIFILGVVLAQACVSGVICGYIAGTLIGAIFWLIEGVRNTLFINHKSFPEPDHTSPYDD